MFLCHTDKLSCSFVCIAYIYILGSQATNSIYFFIDERNIFFILLNQRNLSNNSHTKQLMYDLKSQEHTKLTSYNNTYCIYKNGYNL